MAEDEILRKSLQIHKGLVEVSSLINSITNYDDLLKAILDVARRVIQTEAASLFLVNPETGALELSLATVGETAYVEPRITVPKGKGIAGWVFEKGLPLLIPDAYADERFYKEADRQTGFVTRSILCAPLKTEGRLNGVLQVLNPRGRKSFDETDLEGFCAYADLTATALEKMRALDQIRAQERVSRDLAIASEIQREFLSRAIPANLQDVEFAGHNTPAANVGGDFYGVFTRSPGEVYFAIGDVSGKGISASLLMAQALSAMKFVFATTTGPAEALSHLNETLYQWVIRGMFITTLVGRMCASTRTVEISSAGHCPPLILKSDGTVGRVPVAGALPLGILPRVEYFQTAVELNPGDRLIAFTDGLSESRAGVDGNMFDEVVLSAIAGPVEHSPELLNRIVAAELHHRRGGEQLDDLTVLVGGWK